MPSCKLCKKAGLKGETSNELTYSTRKAFMEKAVV